MSIAKLARQSPLLSAEVIRKASGQAILKNFGLWQTSRSRTPPNVLDLVLEMDAGNLLDSPLESETTDHPSL
jgi:hypothetical protein